MRGKMEGKKLQERVPQQKKGLGLRVYGENFSKTFSFDTFGPSPSCLTLKPEGITLRHTPSTIGCLQTQFSFGHRWTPCKDSWSPTTYTQELETNALTSPYIDMKDYVDRLGLPHGQDKCVPSHPLILDFTMTHDRFERSHLHQVHSDSNLL